MRRFLVASLAFLAISLVRPVRSEGERSPEPVPGWGTFVDPDGDCKAQVSPEGFVIEVPESLHDFWLGQKDPTRRLNAPRVTRMVKGDFRARVRVVGDMVPGPALPGADILPVISAGLYVWDRGNLILRWERSLVDDPDRGLMLELAPKYDVGHIRLVEWKSTQDAAYRDAPALWLQLERKGPRFTTSLSLDGQTWHSTSEVFTIFPDEVEVGILVVNGSARPLTVGFQKLHIGQD